MAHLADMTDAEFERWLKLMKPLVGAPQARAYQCMRDTELKERAADGGDEHG